MENDIIQWVMVAQRATAKILQGEAGSVRLRLRKGISHPRGRMRDQDFKSDHAGRVFRSPGSKARSGTDSENTPHDHEAEVFALELAEILEKASNANAFDELVLVSEPRFLGKLKAALSKSVADKVVRIVDRDLYRLTDAELEKRLATLQAAA